MHYPDDEHIHNYIDFNPIEINIVIYEIAEGIQKVILNHINDCLMHVIVQVDYFDKTCYHDVFNVCNHKQGQIDPSIIMKFRQTPEYKEALDECIAFGVKWFEQVNKTHGKETYCTKAHYIKSHIEKLTNKHNEKESTDSETSDSETSEDIDSEEEEQNAGYEYYNRTIKRYGDIVNEISNIHINMCSFIEDYPTFDIVSLINRVEFIEQLAHYTIKDFETILIERYKSG